MPYKNKNDALAAARKRYAANKHLRRDRINEYHRQWWAKNREQLIAHRKVKIEKLKAENPEEFKRRNARAEAKRKLWHQKNPHCLNEAQRRYRSKNREKIRARHIARKPQRQAYKRMRRETDMNYRIKANLGCRVRNAVRRNGGVKSHRTNLLIGCTVTELRAHLEAKFKPGMTWGNYGRWEIDHVIPCAEFDLRDELQQLRCFHYSNLQPLWRPENRAKADKVLTQ